MKFNKRIYRRGITWLVMQYRATIDKFRWTILKETLKRFLGKLSHDNLKEDMRKVGIFLTGGGLVGLIVANDKVAGPEAFMLVVFGLIFWLIGLFDGGNGGD